ncbi:alpha/beta hydrolase [Dietzia sp. PP-33]|uniref:alpha/beta fold hydrolase n=1 Tax=Dietzia sp. PP-33 TaxID=2957500 RepID=UPI0029B145DF|nr:alpha/beta hydrolase [Dietzia sp. PP-33]MDX2356936.1 alpha/beta hydrolase [Dietzia sp. PP-33]
MFDHRFVDRDGVRLHYVVSRSGAVPDPTPPDDGPGAVVLLHGFPHFWFTWHRMIPELAAAGWRVIAPDLRGMGRSDAPTDVQAYTPREVVDDVLAVCDAEGAGRVVLVGFDFGAGVAYDTCHLEPERVRAVIGMENPFMGTAGSIPPLEGSAMIAEKHFLHMDYFARPGVAEADLAGREREFLTRVFWALSAEYHYLDVWEHPPGSTYLQALPQAPPLPWRWFSVGEMDIYETEYARTGFAGPLQWYRAMDVSWSARKEFERQTNPVPYYFLYSEHDPDLEGFHGRDPLSKLGRHHDDVRMVRAISSPAGHLMHLEATQDTHREILVCLADIAQNIPD